MDTEKKSESDWEQLGPYLLHEQMEQDEPGRGELYRATNETTGATALVLKPTEDGPVPLGGWQVRCVSSASPGYLAMEVEHSSWSKIPGSHWAEGLVCTLEAVHEAMRRMARTLPTHDEPRPWWRLGLAVVGAAAVCALVFVLVRPASVSSPAEGPVSLGAQVERADTFSDVALYDTTPLEPRLFAKPLPREPFKGQKRPPCTRRVDEAASARTHEVLEQSGVAWTRRWLDGGGN